MPMPFLWRVCWRNVADCRLRTFLLRGVVRKFESSIEKFVQIDFFTDCLFGGCGLTGLEEIAAADFDWGKSNDLPRCGPCAAPWRKWTLRRAESAESTVRRGIGGYGFGADADVGPVIRTAGVDGSAREDDRATDVA